MRSFKDNEGRPWAVAVNVASAKRVRGLAGVDLYKLVGGGSFDGLAALVEDPIALVDVIYVLCKDEADRRGVSDEDFGRAMAGDAIEHAAEALLGALADFFPSPRVRAATARLAEAWGKVRARLDARAIDALATIDLDAEIDRALAATGADAQIDRPSTSSGSPGSSPGSSASTPGP